MTRKGIIVYTYEDLEKLQPTTGTIGMWSFHGKCHDGHIICAEKAQHCDYVVGFMHNNMAEAERWMTGTTTLKSFPVLESDVNLLKKYTDVALILKGDYHPHKEHWGKIKNEFDLISCEMVFDYFQDGFFLVPMLCAETSDNQKDIADDQ